MVLLFVFSVLACGNRGTKGSAGEDKVLARINGSAITQLDLNLSIESTLGSQGGAMLDDKGRHSLLESLVAARAIAQVQEKALSPEQNKALEKKVAAYREQLLVKMYLAKNTQSEPVTQQMVQEYYDGHLEQFGGATVRAFEMITTQGAMTDAVRDQLLSAMTDASKISDWPAAVERLKKKGVPAVYSKASSDVKILEPKLREIIAKLSAGQTSDPTFISGQFYIVRVTGDTRIAARPLNEVSSEIRKILLPVQLKKATKQASDQVLGKAKVEYTK
ncbi:MAG: peptidyl-prolyl cis-trans isomerase [Desulfobacteraceae bacterium]|nr:peptidyl-prolyl cis-trans isomerase [Desulfobacteraceae bacterium]